MVARKHAAWLTVCVACVAGFEGLRTAAYQDYNGIWTACYGETLNVGPSDRYTPEQCRDMLAARVQGFGDEVERCTPGLPPKRKAAATSLAYNVGTKRYCASTVAKKLAAGDVQGGCDAFLLYVKASGDVLPGLVKRRRAERDLCLAEVQT